MLINRQNVRIVTNIPSNNFKNTDVEKFVNNDGIIVKNAKYIANDFNEYFVNVGEL